MPKIQFTDEFRQEAIRQIVDRGRPVAEVSAALGGTQPQMQDIQHRNPE